MKKEATILFGVILLMAVLSSCNEVAEQTAEIDNGATKIEAERKFPEQAMPESAEELPDETFNQICRQEEWPPDCNMIPLPQGRAMCEKCKGVNQEKEIGPADTKEKNDRFIIANPLDLSQIARISKFRSCYGHDYSGLNIEGEEETLRSMKHYIEFFPKFLGSENSVKVFAPFDGKITEIIEANGKQPFISADAAPAWHFIFFHLSLEPDIKEGAAVKAGQLVGYAYVREWANFDFALKEFGRRGQIFDSPFLHMPDSILKEYASYGVTPENIIVSKQYRDANPCPVQGTRDGEEAFTGETEKEDFVALK